MQPVTVNKTTEIRAYRPVLSKMTDRTEVGAMALKVQLRNKSNTLAHSLLTVYASLLCCFHSNLDIIYTVNIKIKLSEIKKQYYEQCCTFFAGSSHLVAETFIDCLRINFFI